MFRKLKERWNVRGVDLVLILITFAITGTLTAWISREITDWLPVSRYSVGWWLLKILVLAVGYQLIILMVGFLMGQFSFFWKFEQKLLSKIGLVIKSTDTKAVQVAIFASGAGSNARQIIEHFRSRDDIKIRLVVCNKPGAGVINIARQNNIEVRLVNRQEFAEELLPYLENAGIDFIVLAGFLWKMPHNIVAAFARRIINIHPALLPKYGGKGMYGQFVHEAVITNKEKESGITIHYVDEHYDNGDIIFQQKCQVDETDTSTTLAEKIHILEHTHFPREIEKLIKSKIIVK